MYDPDAALDLLIAVVRTAATDAGRGNPEAQEFIQELAGDFAPTITIPLSREQHSASTRWDFNETEKARYARRNYQSRSIQACGGSESP